MAAAINRDTPAPVHLLKRVATMLAPPPSAQEGSSPTEDPDAIELTLEQRVARIEVEVGDLWEHLRRWSARQAARARRDIEERDREENGAVQGASSPAMRSSVPLVPGSKAWRDHQKALIREGH